MKKNIGYIVLFVIILVACLWAFIASSIITSDFKAKLQNEDLSAKEVNIENLLVTETKDGKKLWELFAENGHYSDDNKVVYLNDAIGNFYEDEKVIASFKSLEATYNDEKKEIVLYNDTLIVHKDGSNIRADKIIWTSINDDVTAIGAIRLEKPGEAIIYGSKATLTNNLSDFKIHGRTKTQLYGRGKSLL